ncbi:MAG TPA: hypothetical protein VH640_09860 [Bryobacteraceae bacterium]
MKFAALLLFAGPLFVSNAFAQPPLKVVATSPAGSPLSIRQAVADTEKRLDAKIAQVGGKEKVYVLGLTRGLYLAGYGAVFTQEVDLIESPHPNPFHQQITPQEAAAVRQRKLENLTVLRKALRDMWAEAAATLAPMPDSEQVVLAVRLLYQPWENKSGLPSQIMVKGERKANAAALQIEEQ